MRRLKTLAIGAHGGAHLSEREFWNKIIASRGSASPIVRSTPGSDDEEELDFDPCQSSTLGVAGFKPTEDIPTLRAFCDLTSERVAGVFERCDGNGDGFLSKAEVSSAFGLLGMSAYVRNVLQILEQTTASLPGRGGEKMMDIYEFDVMFERLRLAELFNPDSQLFKTTSSSAAENVIVCCDYSSDNILLSLVTSEDEQYVVEKFWLRLQDRYNMETKAYGDFFFESRPSFSNHRNNTACLRSPAHSEGASRAVRWVHVDALGRVDRLTLFRLGVKYYLHPLAMDNLLNNKDETRMEVYDDNYVISLSVLMLPRKMQATKDSSDTEQPPRVRIHRSHATVFLASTGPGSTFDTLLSVHHDQPYNSSWLNYWKSDNKAGTQGPERGIWEELLNAVTSEPPHRLREGGADWLLYEIVVQIVQAMQPIAAAYARRMGFMRRQDLTDFKKEWLAELGEVELELSEVARSVRPLKRVVIKMIEDPHMDRLVKVHLADVQDAIDYILEDTNQLSQMCRLLVEQHSAYGEKQANDTLFTISILTALFMPMQLMTGIYGMNFVEEDGSPGIPELKWEFGYFYFWILMVVLFFMSLAMFGLWTGRKVLKSRLRRLGNRLRELPGRVAATWPRLFLRDGGEQASYHRMDRQTATPASRPLRG